MAKHERVSAERFVTRKPGPLAVFTDGVRTARVRLAEAPPDVGARWMFCQEMHVVQRVEWTAVDRVRVLLTPDESWYAPA